MLAFFSLLKFNCREKTYKNISFFSQSIPKISPKNKNTITCLYFFNLQNESLREKFNKGIKRRFKHLFRYNFLYKINF